MTRGPTITYVTDASLDADEQRRVMIELLNLADVGRIRLAIRLPDSSDDDVEELLNWYLGEASARDVPPPLIANRSEIASRYSEVHSWLPTRYLPSGATAEVYSVHNHLDVQRAIGRDAREVIYGHVFETESHPGESGRGLDTLRQIASIPDLTVTAIGGIDEHSIADMARINVCSVACMRAISHSADIAATIKTMNDQWNRNQP